MPTGKQLVVARARAGTFLTATLTITRLDPDDVTFAGGMLTTANPEIVYSGMASIAELEAHEATGLFAAEVVQSSAWLIRAPLSSQTVQPGDQITVDDPGDYPMPLRNVWVHHVRGRQTAVLARIIATATRPGAVNGR